MICSTRKTILLLLTSMIIFVIACQKDPTEPEPDPEPLPNPPYFAWTVNGTSTTVADSSFCYPSINSIFAFKGGNAHAIEIRLSSFAAGTYVVNSVTGNQLEYQFGTKTYNTTGTVTVSESNATILSGSFTCAINSGTLNAISGSFVDVPKR